MLKNKIEIKLKLKSKVFLKNHENRPNCFLHRETKLHLISRRVLRQCMTLHSTVDRHG